MSLKRKRDDPPCASSSELSSVACSNDSPTEADPRGDSPPAAPGTSDIDPALSIFSDRRVTTRTKALVRLREHNTCWLCGYHGVHIAHVVARADAILLSSYIAQGLLAPDFGFHGLANLMLLCAGCHHNFDVRIPIWAFLPADLPGFVAREREFQRLRAAEAAAGRSLAREHGPDEEILYARYLVREGFISPAPFQHTPQKPWAGCAVASILRCQSVISGHVRVPAENGGMPESTMDALYQLLRLYATPPPPVVAHTQRGRAKPHVDVRAAPKRRKVRAGLGRARRGDTPGSGVSPDGSLGNVARVGSRWTLGPGYCANDAIRYVAGGPGGGDGDGGRMRGGRREGGSP